MSDAGLMAQACGFHHFDFAFRPSCRPKQSTNQIDSASDVAAEVSHRRSLVGNCFRTEVDLTATLWEGSELRVGVSRRGHEANARKCAGLLHLRKLARCPCWAG